MSDAVQSFFTLLQVAVGARSDMGRVRTDDEWAAIYGIARMHKLEALALSALDRVPAEQMPSKRPMMRIFSDAQKVRLKNARFNAELQMVADHYAAAGFPGVILKGQGLAALYDDPGVRTPGDIDIWLDGRTRDIIRFVKSENPNVHELFCHHIDCQRFDDIEVEAHFHPSWMNSPFTYARLRRWFAAQKPEQFAHKVFLGGVVAEGDTVERPGSTVAVPTLAFNRIYVLLHIYRHLFQEGIGLRQLLDYYYVLKQGFTEAERQETLRVLRRLKMRRFAAAMMWVLGEVFALDRQYMLLEPSRRDGRFLLSEIMLAGNFGQYDARNAGLGSASEGGKFFRKLRRLAKFLRYYPSEVLWSPFFKIWHFFWRHTH